MIILMLYLKMKKRGEKQMSIKNIGFNITKNINQKIHMSMLGDHC